MTPPIATADAARPWRSPSAPSSPLPNGGMRGNSSKGTEPLPATADAGEPLLSFDDAPPWLISLITHMALILLLGLLIQRAPAQPGYEVTLNLAADAGLAPLDAGGGDLGEESIDVALDGDPADAITDEPTVVSLADPSLEQTVDLQADALLAAAPKSDSLEADLAALPAATGGAGDGDGSPSAGDGSGGGEGNGRGRSKGEGSAPGHAFTSMFGLAGEGGDFVYVFDRSQSMDSVLTAEIDGAGKVRITPLEAAKAELTRSIGDLNDQCRFQVVFYNDIAVLFGNRTELANATIPNKELVKAFIYDMPAESNTNHLVALDKAFRCRPQVLFLLTDGEQKDDPTPSEVRELVRACKELKIKVNVVHFCFELRTTSTLIDLARGTGGEHRFITLSELARRKLDAERGTPTLRPVDMPQPLE